MLRMAYWASTPGRTIGRELRVSWLLEGSVRKSGDMVRIAVQLVRASDGFSAWSGRFDRSLDDIFTVQDDIAGMIAQTLTRRVGKSTSPLVTSTTSNTEAYSFYLEGRYLWNKRPGDVVWQALDRFERAIAIDPSFAPAHAALASVYGTLGAWEFGVLPPAEALAKAKAAATRALELDPQLAAGHTAVGYTRLHFDWNTDLACRESSVGRRAPLALPRALRRESVSGVSRGLPPDRRTRPAQSADARPCRMAPLHGQGLR
jgi:hypothetical protein